MDEWGQALTRWNESGGLVDEEMKNGGSSSVFPVVGPLLLVSRGLQEAMKDDDGRVVRMCVGFEVELVVDCAG